MRDVEDVKDVEVTLHNPTGVGGFTVADHNGEVRTVLRYLLPSGKTLDILHDEELAKLANDKLIELRSNGIEAVETLREYGITGDVAE